MAQKTIALLICSTRSPRIGPSIASWLISFITPHLSLTPAVKLTTLDLASFPLPSSPLGSTIPGELSLPLSSSPYADPEINVWSNVIRQIDAFIILTPQYNWSIPGGLKVALDHLFHEWKGKPMMLVTYGAHGGGKCAKHVRDVWKGLRAGECVSNVELALGGIEEAVKGVLDEKIREGWESAGKEIEVLKGWKMLLTAIKEAEA